MTTDELVKEFIEFMIRDEGTYSQEFARKVYSDVESEVFSLALNDETRDVRYVKVVFSAPEVEAFEVTPVTLIKTAYRRV